MKHVYKKRGSYGASFKPEQCKASIWLSGGVRDCQCSRKPWKDGWCKQHHPDTIKSKEVKEQAKWKAESAAARKRSRLERAAPDLLAYAEAVEAWEAALLMTNESWSDGLPRFTQALYDEWMELQTMRNKAIAKAKGELA